MENEDVILDVDLNRRNEDEWSNIYHLKLVDGIIDTETMNEFEWAYKLYQSKYYLLPSANNNYEVAEQMEMRGMKIYRDIFSHADRTEKDILSKGKYMATKYVLDYR
jgi:hypothetical protein